VSKDASREAMQHILIENINGEAVAVATDGKRMAIVPITVCDEDQLDGPKLILPKTLVEARKQAKHGTESTIGLNGAAMMPNGECHPVREDLNFPNWRQVMPKARAEWLKDSKGGWEPETYKTVQFDAKLLFELSQAIGSVNNRITLQIPVNDPTGPLVIEEKTTGAKGILMPCREN
jgi:hypothetical protein